ncbi:MAG: hypothetical protein [Podoviridae sp. cty5g4]|nr:MAG: hypothetical protein [Podoviridae sp. cty5g4]
MYRANQPRVRACLSDAGFLIQGKHAWQTLKSQPGTAY